MTAMEEVIIRILLSQGVAVTGTVIGIKVRDMILQD